MITYVYDGSFEGLLTTIYDAYYNQEKPDAIESKINLQQNLFESYIEITTDSCKSDKVYNAIQKKISREALRRIYRVYLSNHKESGTLIYYYVKYGFKVGWKINSYLQIDEIRKIDEISAAVGGEVHRFLGLLRFGEIADNLYYAKYEPDNNITCLISDHFAHRLSDQSWIIHDTKRKICSVYNGEGWVVTEEQPNMPDKISSREKEFRELWKKYYKSISIRERENIRLQCSFMPRRYWNNLVEKTPSFDYIC